MSPVAKTVPAESLPVELLARIFLLAKQDQDRESFDYGTPYPSQPVAEVLSQVGTHFRRVALGHSLLWTTVVIEHRTRSDRVQAYCSRSTSSPLSIRIDLKKAWCRTTRAVDHVFELLEIVLHHRLRWETLSIHLGMELTAGRSIVSYLCTYPAPNLHSLTLSIDEADELSHAAAFASPAVPTIFTQGTKMISLLRLRGLAVHAFRPPFAGVTTFHLDGTLPAPISYSAFRTILTEMHQLSHLSLYGNAVEDWPLAHGTLASVISLPALNSLRIHSVEGAGFEGIMMTIDAPYLQNVTLKQMFEGDLMSDTRRFNTTVTLPQVTELTFCDFDLSEIGYRAIARMFPSVEIFRLEYTSIGISKAFITLCHKTTSNGEDSGVVWPCLRVLHMGFDPTDDAWLIEDLLDIRKKMGCPLVRLEFTAPVHVGGGEAVKDWLEGTRGIDAFNVEVAVRGSGEILWPPHPHITHLDLDDILFY